jgi:hypothetical protein
MVPLPRNAHQCCGANDDGPPDEPEHLRLPHGRREYDQRGPDQYSRHLLYIVRSRGTRETPQESLGSHWVRECDAREGDEEQAERDHHDGCDQAHGLARALKSRITMRLSDAGLRQPKPKLIYPDHRLPPWLNEAVTPAIARTVG